MLRRLKLRLGERNLAFKRLPMLDGEKGGDAIRSFGDKDDGRMAGELGWEEIVSIDDS